MRDSETVGKARCGLGGKLAAYRHAAGFSQAKFAALIDYSRSTIANVETGRQHVPRAFWASADTALHAGGALTEANDQMEAASQRERAAAAHAARDAGETRVQCWRGRISWARRGTITAVRFRQHHLLAASLSTCARNWMMRYARAPWPRPASTTGKRAAIRFGRATRDRPARVLLGDLTADLAELKRALRTHRSASALRRLTGVTAQMSGLMCLTLCKLDDRPAVRRWPAPPGWRHTRPVTR